jgi:penicillin-binding protein 2
VQRIISGPGLPDYQQKPEKLGQVILKDEVWKDLGEAMRLVVSSGTGVTAQIAGLDIAGKTGTAQNSSGKDHAWFISFAARPGQPAEVAVAVLVENGGHGSSAAVPIARSVMMAAYGMDNQKLSNLQERF